jgi:hypothetical protein
MKKIILAALLLTLMSIRSVCVAEEMPDNVKSAASNFQYELTTCLAFFSISNECVKLDAKNDIKLEKVINELNDHAVDFGKSIGMTDDAILARVALQISEQKKLINSDCTNLASLLARYTDRCKRIYNHPDEVMKEFMGK